MAWSERNPSRRSVLAGMALSCAAVQAGGCDLLAQPSDTESSSWDRAAFPLRVRPGCRYLEDATGKPFLVHGDAAWSLIAQLGRDDAEAYLEDRRRRGFNTLTVNLLEHRFASRAPANAHGQQPFRVPGDFATPNEDYFAHAAWVLKRAEEKGMIVLLAPAWLGYQGGGDGWYREVMAAGLRKLRGYGRFLGLRYGSFSNIIWMHAGDFNPPQKDLVRAIAEGLLEFDRNALHTAHCAPETAVLEYWAGEPWLALNNIYTYKSVRRAALRQYARPEGLPFFLMESAYENEHGAGGQRARVQAYEALLSGACGHVFGNNPVWHFDGPGLHPSTISWRPALDSEGARSMEHLRRLFSQIPWWLLEPAADELVVAANTAWEQEAAAALTSDRGLGLIYLPTGRPAAIDLGALSGPKLTAHWHDPRTGGRTVAAGSPLQASGRRTFAPPRKEAAGQDWLLILTRAPER